MTQHLETEQLADPAAPVDRFVDPLPVAAGQRSRPVRPATPRDGTVRQVRVARQGIYDARRQLVSYELLFRSGRPQAVDAFHDGRDPGAGEQATSQVIASTFGTFGLDSIADGKPAFINFTRAFLTGVIPIPVDPKDVVVEVVDRLGVDHELLLGLAQLRQAGYRIAVDDYRGDLGRSALVEMADYVKIHVSSLPTMLVPGLVQSCRQTGATLVATGVEDNQSFVHAAELGFELFQGPYLHRPTMLERRTLSPSQIVCVRLLNDLADPEASIHRIEQLVGSDPGLTLRLLRTANSASASGAEVTSLRQALVLIGPRKLRSWVVLTLLEGGTTRNSSDDLWSVLARAHACQRLAEHQGDLAFTVGLLSGAADMLGADADTVAAGSGIGVQARAALLDGEGEAGRALLAVLAHERDDPDAITSTGLVPFDVSRAYLESLSESLQLVHDLLGR
jgi:EAL and modified HD-GYP domain-containing signal transduction protein